MICRASSSGHHPPRGPHAMPVRPFQLEPWAPPVQPEPVTTASNAAAFTPSADDVFGRVAKRYDLLSDVFSFGVHRLWKRRVAEVIAGEPWSTLLDGATGTGDITLRVLAHESKR